MAEWISPFGRSPRRQSHSGDHKMRISGTDQIESNVTALGRGHPAYAKDNLQMATVGAQDPNRRNSHEQ